jgi:hypothetical protein
VRDNEKLEQDIIKALLTTLGSNIFHKWYGNSLSMAVIGQSINVNKITSQAESDIQNTLSTIIALQNMQARTQYVSAGETIAAIQNIMVLRDNVDPRQFQLTVSVLTRKLNIVEATFSLRI